MAKAIKLKNDNYLDTKGIVHRKIILDTYLSQLVQMIDSIKYDVLWAKSKGKFNPQVITLNTNYDMFLIEYNLYTGGDLYSSKIVSNVIGRIYEISDTFAHGSKYFTGRRDFQIQNGSIEFWNATNETGTGDNSIDNNWYNIVRITGIKLGGGVIKLLNLIANLIGGGAKYANSN